MSSYRILIGADPTAPDFEFTASELRSRPQRVSELDPISAHLSVDELTARVSHRDGAPYVFAPAGTDGVLTSDGYLFGTAQAQQSLLTVVYGTPVHLADASGVIATLYFMEAKQLDRTLFELRAASVIGFLDRVQHLGGIYARTGAAAVIAQLIGSAFAYTVEADVAAVQVDGYLPVATARNNLHRLMLAYGISIRRDSAGQVVFCFLGGGTPAAIPDSRVFFGSKLDYSRPNVLVEVTEHSYISIGDETEEELFSNADGVAVLQLTVIFAGPHHSLRTEGGLNIQSSGANHAIVSGFGTLYGRPYTHRTQILRRGTPDATGMQSTVTVADVGLVNSLNSRAVAERLYQYHSTRREMTAPLRLEDEKTGDLVQLTGPEGDPVSGYLSRLETAYSTFPRALAKLVTGYTPGNFGNWYNDRVLITATGDWTVPAGVTSIRVYLFQGGAGGDGGYDGADGMGNADMETGYREAHEVGSDTWYRSYSRYRSGAQHAAAGGEAGAAGKAGKYYAVDLTVTPGSVLHFTVGAGGVGGARNGGKGSAGGETSVQAGGETYSTTSGSEIPGYKDLITGARYALPGEPGTPGADGGTTDTVDLLGWSGAEGLPGGSIGIPVNNGGVGATGSIMDGTGYASGGGGGGAAYGRPGGFGGAGTVNNTSIAGGPGGAGANAQKPATPSYGCGGGGGNGGGGGGNGGGANRDLVVNVATGVPPGGLGGIGGQGSEGGDGGPGCAVIFMRRT